MKTQFQFSVGRQRRFGVVFLPKGVVLEAFPLVIVLAYLRGGDLRLHVGLMFLLLLFARSS
jgi:hypothetical protein